MRERRPLKKRRFFNVVRRGRFGLGWEVLMCADPSKPESWITKNWFLTNRRARRYADWAD